MTGTAAQVLRLATRGSALARAQAELAARALMQAGGMQTELVVVRTTGDRRPDAPLDALPGQGWFTAELERALLEGRADIAVHSAKDLPTRPAAGLEVAGLLPRTDPADVAVTRDGGPLTDLPGEARVGTSSARRSALLRELHPHLVVVPMRGNVDTRLRKLDLGEVDALVLAGAGLERLGLAARIRERLDPEVFVPAPAQGAIALQAVQGSAAARACAAADDASCRAAVTAERAVLELLGGSCLLPLGVLATVAGERLAVTAALGVGEGIRRARATGAAADPQAVVAEVARRLQAR